MSGLLDQTAHHLRAAKPVVLIVLPQLAVLT